MAGSNLHVSSRVREKDLRTYIGLSYVDHGRSFSGVDCWGLVLLWSRCYRGVMLPDYAKSYASADDMQGVEMTMLIGKRAWTRLEAPSFGDVVLFRMHRFLCHAGVSIGDGKFLHVLRGRNSTIEQLDSLVWRDSLEGVYRWTAT